MRRDTDWDRAYDELLVAAAQLVALHNHPHPGSVAWRSDQARLLRDLVEAAEAIRDQLAQGNERS